jgi:hypothetical protein
MFDQRGLPAELVLHGKPLGLGNHEGSVLTVSWGGMHHNLHMPLNVCLCLLGVTKYYIKGTES